MAAEPWDEPAKLQTPAIFSPARSYPQKCYLIQVDGFSGGNLPPPNNSQKKAGIATQCDLRPFYCPVLSSLVRFNALLLGYF
jgi:hypothetical protein